MNQSELTNSILERVSLEDSTQPASRRLFRPDHHSVNTLLSEAVVAVDSAVSTLLEGHIISLQRLKGAWSFMVLFDDGDSCSSEIVRLTHSALFLREKPFVLGAGRVAQRLVAGLAAEAALRFAKAD